MKLIRNLAVLLALGAGVALFCEACHFLGGAAASARTSIERPQS